MNLRLFKYEIKDNKDLINTVSTYEYLLFCLTIRGKFQYKRVPMSFAEGMVERFELIEKPNTDNTFLTGNGYGVELVSGIEYAFSKIVNTPSVNTNTDTHIPIPSVNKRIQTDMQTIYNELFHSVYSIPLHYTNRAVNNHLLNEIQTHVNSVIASIRDKYKIPVTPQINAEFVRGETNAYIYLVTPQETIDRLKNFFGEQFEIPKQ